MQLLCHVASAVGAGACKRCTDSSSSNRSSTSCNRRRCGGSVITCRFHGPHQGRSSVRDVLMTRHKSHVTHTSHIRHTMHIFTFYRIFCVILASEFPSSSTCRASKTSTFSWTLRLASPTLPLLPCPPTLTLLPCPRRLSCPTCLPFPPRGRPPHAAAQCRRTRTQCLRCGLALQWCRNQVCTAGDTSCLP